MANRSRKRKEGVHGRLVGADDDAPAADLLELADRDLGICGEAQQPRRAPSCSSRPASVRPAVADRAIEQPVAELFLEAPNRLADRRLGAVELFAATEKLRSAATVTNVPRSCSCTKWIIIWSYLNQTSINWTAGRSQGYKRNSPRPMTTTNRLTIFDTTLRDGEQAPASRCASTRS